MAFKDILKVFKLERELTDDETALLNTLRGMSESERELLAETLGPVSGKSASKSAKGKATRVIEKCATEGCGLTRRAAVHKDENVEGYHQFESEKDIQLCDRCKSATAKHPIHHEKAFGGYHEFVPPKTMTKKATSSRRRGMPASSSQPPRCVVCFEINDHINHDLDNGGHLFEASVSARAVKVLEKYEICHALIDDNGGEIACGKTMDDNVHHKPTDPDYHEFVGSETAVGVGGD